MIRPRLLRIARCRRSTGSAAAPAAPRARPVPEQQLQQQRDVAEDLDIDRGDLADEPVRRQPRDADEEAEDGREDDAEDGDVEGVQQADDEGAAVGGIRAVGDERGQDLEAGAVLEEAEAGGDVGALQIGDRVVDDPPEEGDEEDRERDLEDDAADRRDCRGRDVQDAARTDAGVSARRSPWPTP